MIEFERESFTQNQTSCNPKLLCEICTLANLGCQFETFVATAKKLPEDKYKTAKDIIETNIGFKACIYRSDILDQPNKDIQKSINRAKTRKTLRRVK